MTVPHPPRPLEPSPPEPGECCGSGCDPCVYDLYDMAMERYKALLARWEAEHGHAPSGHAPSSPGTDAA